MSWNDGNAPKKVGFFTMGKLFTLIGILVLLILAISITHTVSPGHVGVVNNKMNGGIEEVTLGQGWNWVAPYKTVTEYPISTEVAYFTSGEHDNRKTDDSIVIGTKDGKTMRVDAQMTYHMDREDLPHIFNKFKGADINAIEYGYMRQNFQRIANDLSSQYTMMDIVGERKADYNAKLFKAVLDFFGQDGITIEQAGLGKVEPDEATKGAIQAVANAQYSERQAEYEKKAAIANAQTVIEKARGLAEAKRLEADAEAYRNQKIAQSTDARVVELEWVKKWDGKLPQQMFGQGQSFMLNLNK